VRVLFISDVYFPRVNGVSTSIRTFRADLAQQGVQTQLVVPRYAHEELAAEPGITRIAAGRVPADPEDRACAGEPLTRTLDQLPAGIRPVHPH
jgi:hypothetical protein